MRPTLLLLAVLVVTSIHAQESANHWSEPTEGERLFALHVAPMIESKCISCHGQTPNQIESGLSLLDREAVLRGGDTAEPVLTPGDRSKSWLYRSATWLENDLQMPPKETDRLDNATLEALGRWIDLGAPWPSAERTAEIHRRLGSGISVTTSGGLDAAWDERRYDVDSLWAYHPLRTDLYPKSKPSQAYPVANLVDRFVNDELLSLGLTPAPRADRRTLIRRLHFDLLGLPPLPEEVKHFVDDPAPEDVAWTNLVDRLLASPQLGEQWARHWLDTVRYADSAGFANDYERPNAWRYRDYVVRSFNVDRPLDQFIRQQLAGDEFHPNDSESLIATGMLRMGPWEQTGMSVDKVTRQQFLDDVTDVVGQTFLAHPLQCARCHDHKFDPIPTRDFYRIQAVFATTQFAERNAPFLASENQGGFSAQRRYLRERIKTFETILNELTQKEERAQQEWYVQRGLDYAPRNAKLKAGVPEEQIAPRKVGFQAADFGLERIARKYLERHRWELERFRPVAFSVYSGPTPERRSVSAPIRIPDEIAKSGIIEATAILTGGDPFSPSTPVTPGIFSAVSGILQTDTDSNRVRSQSSITSEPFGRRREFAEWITNPTHNPLTPRVMVNRIWQHHFGQGIVTTPNNFGTSGAKPTHPKLLDYLANELIRSDWSIKHIHRLILTSEVYRRSNQRQAPNGVDQELTEKDPLGNSYAVFRIRRLSAEELRDSVLSASGLLSLDMGGVPVRPEINAEVALQPRQIMGTYAPIYQPSPLPQDRNRRTLYAQKLRGLRDPMLDVFNQPSPDLPCESRDSSTVATQALTLINSPFSYQRAVAMAESLLREFGDSDNRTVERAFQKAYGRSATKHELAVSLEHWQDMTIRHQDIQLEDTPPPINVTREFVDENTGQSFSFTEVLEQNRDFVPDTSLNDASPRVRGLAELCLVLLSSNEFLYVP